MNLEVKSRLKYLNKKLKSETALTFQDINHMQGAYKDLTECQALLAKNVSKVMLFNLAQMIMLIIFRTLNAVVFCVMAEEENTKSISWCATNLVYTIDCMWRFSMIAWSCGSLQAEVSLYVDLLHSETLSHGPYRNNEIKSLESYNGDSSVLKLNLCISNDRSRIPLSLNYVLHGKFATI
jgi:hypothetical protein